MALPVIAQEDQTSQANQVLASARERINRDNDAAYNDGNFQVVIQNQRTLAELDPHDEETWSNLAWMYGNIEHYTDEWLTCRRFAKNNAAYADGPYYEAQFFYFHKVYGKVPALLEPVLKMNPAPDPNAFRFLAHSYDKLGYSQDSLRVWDLYLAKRPDDRQAKINRDRVAAKLAAKPK
ncbi:MAG: hypothetical protein JSS66_08740 [Armatimonadetes bacterium]|nr:hypothetical protein [Armatimonadota bacterium]